MSATDKKARVQGGRDAEQETVSRKKNIPQESILEKIIRLREKWHMLPDEWRRASIIFALMYRDSAPESVRAKLTGKPSFLPKEAVFLCEIFLLILVEAEERLRIAGGDVDLELAWLLAEKLWGRP
jgi:hypothetical protein